MGDIFTRPENDANGMAHVVRPRPGLLQTTLGGIGATVAERYATVRANQSSTDALETAMRFIEEVDGYLRTILRDRPDLPFCTDPSDDEAVAYQHIRLQHRAAMRSALRKSLARQYDNNGIFFRTAVDEYNDLVSRAGRNAAEANLLGDTAALLARLFDLSDGNDVRGVRRRLLIGLLHHLHADLITYSERRHPGRSYRPEPTITPLPPPPPPPPTVAAAEVTEEVVRRTDGSTAARTFRTPPVVTPADPIVPNETCAVCLDADCAPRLPCGHKCMCAECAASVDRCPLCRDQYDPSEVAWADKCGTPYIIPAEGCKREGI